MLVEPLLEVRLGPGLVKPVTRVSSGLASLLSDGLVVFASGREESVTGARLGGGDAVFVEESLKGGLGPAGKS